MSGTSATLDASASASNGVGISKVQFVLTGGSYNKTVIGTATPAPTGTYSRGTRPAWPNGTYTLQSLATDGAGNTTYSAGDHDHGGQHAADDGGARPRDAAPRVSGTSATLDASASAANGVGISKVQFVLTGGTYNKTVIGTATLTALRVLLLVEHDERG